MPKFQSDDVARELRYVFMGPPEFRLPAFQGHQWIAAVVTLVTGGAAIWLLRPGFAWGVGIALIALIAAYVAGWSINKIITTETNLEYVAFTAVSETLAPRDSGPVTITTSLPADLFVDAEEPTK